MRLSSLSRTSPRAAKAGEPEWPQFRGPRRDNKSSETGLLKLWPAGGPKLVWTAKGIGSGYSSVAIARGLIYTTGNIGEDTLISALALDGSPVWKAKNGPAYKRSYPGTRSTPTVDGEKLIVVPGGEKIGMVALGKLTGEAIWTCEGTRDKPGYASAIVFEHGGIRQVATLLSRSVVGVDAETGALLWQTDHEAYYEETIAVPIFLDGHVIVSTLAAGTRSLALSVHDGKVSVREAWRNDRLDNQHGGIVEVDGHIYGCSSRGGPGPWMCLEAKTGAMVWGHRGIGRASFTYADGHLYASSEDGVVALVRPSPRGFELVSEFRIPKGGAGPTWAHPVVCGGRLYVRHDDILYCYAVRDG
ncbi:MAG: outer membrane protein assembly factor BamB family protein [Planctomycetota bacterium]